MRLFRKLESSSICRYDTVAACAMWSTKRRATGAVHICREVYEYQRCAAVCAMRASRGSYSRCDGVRAIACVRAWAGEWTGRDNTGGRTDGYMVRMWRGQMINGRGTYGKDAENGNIRAQEAVQVDTTTSDRQGGRSVRRPERYGGRDKSRIGVEM